MKVQLHAFFNSILEVGAQLRNHAALPPGQKSSATIEWQAGGTTAGLEGLEKGKNS